MIDKLPIELKMKISDEVGDKRLSEATVEIRKAITDYLTTIIKKSSMGQTKKGILTTGPKNSIGYALAKLKKGRKKS